MKEVRWDPLKNEWLKRERGLGFDDILLQGALIQNREHPVRNNQRLMLYDVMGYIWVVPYVERDQEIFLKTAYQSRKLTQLYREGGIARESELENEID